MDAPRFLQLTLLLLMISLTAVPHTTAQIPAPASQRPISGGGSASVGVRPKAPEKMIVKTITYITLSENRQWTSSDGKPLLAKLIAFEDIVTETTGTGSPSQPTVLPATPPTLVKDGKIRLLVNRKPFELAVDRLSQPDRDFIENIRTAIQKKATSVK